VAEPGTTRSVTIDARRHVEIVEDLAQMARRGGGHWWRVPAYRRQARSTAYDGLDIGQTVTATYTARDVLTFTDATGDQLACLEAATPVGRFRSLLVVHSPRGPFVVPAELLSVEDVAFLAGPGPQLPLHLEITAEIQESLVGRATGLVVRSADFLLSWVAALGMLALWAGTELWGFLLLAGLFVVLALPGLFGLAAMRRRFRRLLPVGWTMRAEVTADRLFVTQANGAVTHAWRDYTALRMTDDCVLLRLRRRPFAPTRTQVLPRALFGPEEVGRLSVAVAKRF
jgi:hypothetical protein